VDSRLEMAYGNEARATPLRANLSQYDFIRIHFKGISTGLNFNVEAFTGTAYSQWAATCQLRSTRQRSMSRSRTAKGRRSRPCSTASCSSSRVEALSEIISGYKIELVTRDTH